MTRFSKLVEKDSKMVETEIRDIPQSSLRACPHFIILAEHYRPDNTCRCDDPTHKEMSEWGYRWINGRWR